MRASRSTAGSTLWPEASWHQGSDMKDVITCSCHMPCHAHVQLAHMTAAARVSGEQSLELGAHFMNLNLYVV